MRRRVFAAAVFVVALTMPTVQLAAQSLAPPSPQSARLWTQVHGRVESIRDTQVTLKTDSGQRLRVDISPMGWGERRELVPGARTTLVGYLGDRPNEFVAWFLPMPETPAASPPQPERPEPQPRIAPVLPPAPR